MGSGGGRGDEAAQGQPYEQGPAAEFVDGVGDRRDGAGDSEGFTSPAAVAGQVGCRGGVVFSDGLDHGLPHRAAHTLIGARQLDLAPPDTGSLQGDLEALLHTIATLLTTPPASDIAAAVLGAATHSAELAAQVKDFFADRIAREEPLFTRAMERGELPADADPMLLVDLLAGAAWIRVVLRQLPLEKDFVSRTVHTVLQGARAADLGPTRHPPAAPAYLTLPPVRPYTAPVRSSTTTLPIIGVVDGDFTPGSTQQRRTPHRTRRFHEAGREATAR